MPKEPDLGGKMIPRLKKRIVLSEDEKKEIEMKVTALALRRKENRGADRRVPCLGCARPIYRGRSWMNGHQDYCSKKCMKRGNRRTVRARESDLSPEQRRLTREMRRSQRQPKLSYQQKSQLFFLSEAWKEMRFKAFLRHGRQCQCCGAKPPGIVLHVDHIKPRFSHPELELDIDNLQVLCADCNIGKGARHHTDFRIAK